MAKQPLWSPPELDAAFGFPSEFPYEFEISSPAVESVAGSSSTESTESSDEEESFFAGLTQRLSQSTLNETRNKLAAEPINAWNKPQATVHHSTKTRDMAGSPQSILSGIGSWSTGSNRSGNGSPNGNSRVPSPVTAPFTDPWEVIYAAAGQVARLKMNNLVGPAHVNLVQPEVKQKQECGSVWETDPNWLLHQRQLLIQNRRRELGYETGRCNVPMSFQPHPQNQRVQQYTGSGFRVPVPGGSSVKKPSGGTGVFLPRHYDNNTTTTPSASHKRTGCGPVMQPVKPVNGLNLNIGDMNVTAQNRFTNCFTNDFDLLLARRNAVLKQQRLIALREEAASCEIRLPQEWTY
ncbi:uncharacterized protein LOC127083908 isoform X1 [Lathyrus oleraceus]|uniref:Uncharacterized protein n=1 Tax=Pisum sativum TaxID=3888 RepID=A0A9D5ADL6_PEA|nr:uncharacterized protein LOC127083908 isoform X1 [Pisum sativum]KAI5407527.1 hypothetical protein KIW84_053691 [Pisum sativum]